MTEKTEKELIALLVNSVEQWETPTAEELADAPIIEDWEALDADDEDNLPTFFGRVFNHPFAEDGMPFFAEEAFAMPADLKWVFTMSRLYRLGKKKRSGDDG